MADSFVQVPPDSTGKKVDAASLDVGVNTVMRQRIVIADNSATAGYATVTGGALVVTGNINISAMPAITGTVNLSGTAIVAGNVTIASTAQVAIGTPFTVNNVSATVTVAGTVSLAAGADINSISRTVQVAVGTPFTINNVSATVTVAGVVNLSATAAVVLAAGTANIGLLNAISRTVDVALAGKVALSGTSIVGLAYVTEFSSGSQVAVGDSANQAVRVSIVAGGGGVASQVSLAAGTSNIGLLDSISRTVQVAIGTPFTINNISASVAVATGAFGDFDTSGAAVQNVALFGIALPAAGGASAGGTNANPLWVNVNTHSQTAAVVLAAGTALIGDVNAISRTVQVAVGTPFTVNNVSATVVVAGTVSLAAGGIVNVSNTASVVLAAGAANIGTVNDISRTVQVAVGTPFTVNNISATVTVAGIVNLSATASVILAAGAANIGTVNGISQTVQVAIGTPFTVNAISATVTTVVSGFTPAIMSASHGPKCVTASTSANVTLIASPGAGKSVFVTQLMVGNYGLSVAKARIGTSASTGTVVQPIAANGGGFVLNFNPPWMLSASEACLCSVKPNTSDLFFTVNFYVA